jgi:branched-chain amino acid transport system permease protein
MFAMADPFSVTQGENGIAGISRGIIFGIIEIKSEIVFYYFVWVSLVASFICLYLIKKSSLGDVLSAIRENSERVPFLGFDLKKYKILSFLISGAFGGLSGCLMALHESSVSPEILHWFFSADALFFVVLGGPGTLVGPILSTSIIILFQEILSDLISNWMAFMGAIFICLVFFFPKGLYPSLEKIAKPKR